VCAETERDKRATVVWRTQAVLASVAANGGMMNGVNVASAVRNVAEALDRCRAPRAAVLAVLHDARFHQQLMALVRITVPPQTCPTPQLLRHSSLVPLGKQNIPWAQNMLYPAPKVASTTSVHH